MTSFTVAIAGFDEALSRFGPEMESAIIECGRIAINDTARWIVSRNSPVIKDMEGNVNFPTGYLRSNDRFKVGKFASNETMSAEIHARAEPTSLARFALDAQDKGGIMVHVRKGRSPKLIKRAFISGIKRGEVAKGNRGLIVRSEGPPPKAWKPRKLNNFPNLWLLYGPSVYQVFRQSMDRFDPMVQDELSKRFAILIDKKMAGKF